MKTIKGDHLSVDALEAHNHICDLINVEYPVLSLYSDGKRNWIYLWCDTDGYSRNRWLLFPASRSDLLAYLKREMTAREMIWQADALWLLDASSTPDVPIEADSKRAALSRYLRIVQRDRVLEYLPRSGSYFDPELTEDLDLTRQFVPSQYSVPILGTWFGKDFENIFRSYERLYAFFYSTRPSFIRTIASRFETLLRSPWEGGFSRLNLYVYLARQIPALHALKVSRLEFASPGKIEFEAIDSIGTSIARTALLYIDQQEGIEAHVKKAKKILTSARLNRINLSDLSDEKLPLLNDQLSELKFACDGIAKYLQIEEELESLNRFSPNTVVYSKAVISFIFQLKRLVKMQQDKIVNFSA